MSTYHFNSGDFAMIRGSIYECNGKGPGGKYQFVAQKNRSSLYLGPEEIYDFFDQGKFRKLEPNDTNFSNLSKNEDSYTYDLSSESSEVRLEVLQRKFYMEAIRDYTKDGGKLSEVPLKILLEDTFKKLCNKTKTEGDEIPDRPMSYSSAKRWYKKWRDSGYEIISLVRERRGNCKPRLELEVREVMEDIIENRYLSKLRITAKKTYKEIGIQIKILNKDRKRKNLPELKKPTYETVLKHISKIDEYEKLAARYGHEYASKMTRPYGITPKVNRALERVQMDHTQLDVYVDMGEKYLIRPHLTLAIDAYSKAILGYWISVEPPSAESVMNCLNIAILKKDVVLLGGEKNWDYSMSGIPTELTVDNGKDFHSKDLEIACAQLGITLNFTPPRKPYYKSQVERKFGEINTSLLISLPGRVYKKEPEKRGKDYPHLPFDVLNRLLLQWITTVLHKTPNKEGKSPIDLWFESESKFGKLPCPFDEENLSITLGKAVDGRTLGPDGIRFNNLKYNNSALSSLRRSLAKPHGRNPKVLFKWNARDVGFIWVLDEKQNRYFRVPALQTEVHGRSNFRHKVITREMSARKKAGLEDSSYIESEHAIDVAINNATNSGNSKSTSRISRYKEGKSRTKIPVKAPALNPDDEIVDFGTEKTIEVNNNTSHIETTINKNKESIIDFSHEIREL